MTFIKQLMVVLFLSLMVVEGGYAATLEAQCLKKNYENQSIQNLLKKANNNDGLSSCLVGLAYASGDKGVSQSFEKAFEYFENSYEAGFLEAGYYLGVLYQNGYGVNRDFDQYLQDMTAAGEAGYLPAQKQMLDVYLYSKAGVQFADDDKAAYWLKKASMSGDSLSMYALSTFYIEGRGVSQNEEKAFEWIMEAVEKDEIIAYERAGDFYAQGIGTEQDLVRAYMMYDLGGTASSGKKAELAEQMTQAQIDEAVSLSRQWQEEHNSYRPSYHGLEAHGSDGHYEYQ
ncbi:tetratricopeptide repeat protein [Salinicola aestuarinus]|uniref:tetratricopeptide repeat protein n=1 Tax=Salinicola aestuarinus TaxID=1949082 RepID=UPI000DA24EC6|nr:tetratricopeptide repeat protein [Salinicola aestuarinus]